MLEHRLEQTVAVSTNHAEQEGRDARWAWVVVLTLLGLCAASLVWFPVLRLSALPSINYNEGWNAYRQSMAGAAQPLYGGPPGLWITNYPFVSFHIIGLLGGAIGSVTLAGRVAAFAGMIAVALLAGAIVRVISGSSRGGLYAGLCLLLWISTFTPERRAANDPELLAAAIASFGLFAYIRAPRNLVWSCLSALAFAVAMFTKQDLLALPLSVGVHLLLTRNWRALAAWSASGIVAASLLLDLTYRLDGAYFFANLLQPRAYLLHTLRVNVVSYLVHFGVTLAIATAMLISRRAVPHRSFLLILLLATFGTSIVFAGGDGVAQNIFYPCLIAVAIAYAAAISCLSDIPRRTRTANRVFIAALVIPALLSAVFVPFRVGRDIAAWRALPLATEAARHAVGVLTSVHGPAICEDILLCYRAGKELDFDPYFVNDQLLIGRIKQSAILAMLVSHHYTAIEIDGVASTALPSQRRRFNKAFMQTLFSHYRLVSADGFYAVFEPGH